MNTIERIETGRADCEDAARVHRLVNALAGCIAQLMERHDAVSVSYVKAALRAMEAVTEDRHDDPRHA